MGCGVDRDHKKWILSRAVQNRPSPMAASGSTSTNNTTVQLNVRVEILLANRLRQRAKELHTNPGALVAQAIEQFLDGSPQAQDQPDDVLQRFKGLEDRVAALEAEKKQSDSQ